MESDNLYIIFSVDSFKKTTKHLSTVHLFQQNNNRTILSVNNLVIL